MPNIKNLHIAQWWEAADNGKLLCTLCPRYCTIGEGQKGFCFVRENIGGKLYAVGYGRPTGFAIDPIEKKPLSHFLPGTKVLSFGTAGCNLGCKFCQNWHISKAKLDEAGAVWASPEEIIALAKRNNTPSIAFTYNDPTIFGEYVIDISKLSREEGIKSVMVTAGYIDKEARKDVYKYIDAANVDLKAFSEYFYHKITFSHLEPVLDTIKWLFNETDVWVELTTLLIPGENDSDEEIKNLSDWVITNLNENVPIHFTAFHPDFKMRNTIPTPPQTLIKAREIAKNIGLNYVYVGNVHNIEGQTTYCPGCNEPVIIRDWHSVLTINMIGSQCKYCGTQISGKFEI